MKAPDGTYGGRVLRKFNGNGTQFMPGAELTPELVAEWPVANRRALHHNGTVEWYGPTEVKKALAVPPAESKVKAESKAKAPAKSGSRRTTRTTK